MIFYFTCQNMGDFYSFLIPCITCLENTDLGLIMVLMVKHIVTIITDSSLQASMIGSAVYVHLFVEKCSYGAYNFRDVLTIVTRCI